MQFLEEGRVTGKPGILADIAAASGPLPHLVRMPAYRSLIARACRASVAVVLLAASGPLFAWGAMGHRLIGQLAEEELTPVAREQVARLLAPEPVPTLAGVASWADELRDNDPGLGRRTTKWHYVNVDEPACTYDAASDCAGDACVVGAIATQTAILGDRRRSDTERREALKFVVHFIGDVHQPLHASTRGKGGNEQQVRFDGRGTNLHSLWDSGLLNALRVDEDAHLRRLRLLPLVVPLQRDARVPDAKAWAEASCRIAVSPGLYPASAKLDATYPARWMPIIDERLRHAATQLAAVLNATLGTR